MTEWDTCMLCPRLCRTACPVASGTAREAAVPALIAGVLREWEEGRVGDTLAREAATLCVDCGACQDLCHLHRPLPAALSRVRAELVAAPGIEALQRVEGEAERVAVEADPRPLAAALSRALGEPIARWPTGDRLGVAAVEHPSFAHHAQAIERHAEGRSLVVADGGVARALDEAGVEFHWVHALVPGLGDGVGSCVLGTERPLACCGGAGPLPLHHPDDARRVGELFLRRMGTAHEVVDARCRQHLGGCGGTVHDVVDRLLERHP